MKKRIYLLLVCSLLRGLCACGGGSEEPPTEYLDLETISGYWKYDNYDNYYAIYSENVWAVYDMAGTELGSGDLILEDDLMTLNREGSDPLVMTVVSFGQLVDGDGDTLSRFNPPTQSPPRPSWTPGSTMPTTAIT